MAAFGGAQEGGVGVDEAEPGVFLQGAGDGGEAVAGALLEQAGGYTVGEAHGVEHEFEGQLA